jgi:hypothetical protein
MMEPKLGTLAIESGLHSQLKLKTQARCGSDAASASGTWVGEEEGGRMRWMWVQARKRKYTITPYRCTTTGAERNEKWDGWLVRAGGGGGGRETCMEEGKRVWSEMGSRKSSAHI